MTIITSISLVILLYHVQIQELRFPVTHHGEKEAEILAPMPAPVPTPDKQVDVTLARIEASITELSIKMFATVPQRKPVSTNRLEMNFISLLPALVLAFLLGVVCSDAAKDVAQAFLFYCRLLH